jgi:hypothetical protein
VKKSELYFEKHAVNLKNYFIKTLQTTQRAESRAMADFARISCHTDTKLHHSQTFLTLYFNFEFSAMSVQCEHSPKQQHKKRGIISRGHQPRDETEYLAQEMTKVLVSFSRGVPTS